MVSAETLKSIFDYRDGKLYWKSIEGRRKETESRFVGKEAGCKVPGGYRIVSFTADGVKHKHLSHRVIYAMHHNVWPEFVDHIDRNPENNRVDNLRPADKRLNSINRNNPSNNTSGVRGVSKNKSTGKWEAYIKNRQKRVNLGLHVCIGQAIKARKDAEAKYWADV